MVFQELIQWPWMITENFNMKVLVCLDSFGEHEALFLSSQGSPGFDRRP